MSWREIPIPDRIAALPRSPGGLPVPYVAQWSSERELSPRPDPLLQQYGFNQDAAYSAGQRGDGTPDFGVMEPGRQREVALLVRCQVCRHPLLPRHRIEPNATHPVLLADLRSASTAGDVAFGGAAIRIGRRMRPLIFEPWVCEPCLGYALQVCPGLLSLSYHAETNPAKELRLLHVRRARPVATRTRTSAGREVLSYIKLAAIDYDVVRPADYLERHQDQEPATV